MLVSLVPRPSPLAAWPIVSVCPDAGCRTRDPAAFPPVSESRSTALPHSRPSMARPDCPMCQLPQCESGRQNPIPPATSRHCRSTPTGRPERWGRCAHDGGIHPSEPLLRFATGKCAGHEPAGLRTGERGRRGRSSQAGSLPFGPGRGSHSVRRGVRAQAGAGSDLLRFPVEVRWIGIPTGCFRARLDSPNQDVHTNCFRTSPLPTNCDNRR